MGIKYAHKKTYQRFCDCIRFILKREKCKISFMLDALWNWTWMKHTIKSIRIGQV